MREINFGLREMNFELREINFGLRELKFELREINLSCEVLDSQSHRTVPFSKRFHHLYNMIYIIMIIVFDNIMM